MEIEIRAFESDDLEQVLPILNRYYLEPATAEDWLRENEQDKADGNIVHQAVAVDTSAPESHIVGYGSLRREYGTWDAGRLQLWVITDPDHRREGVGSQLYSNLLTLAVEREQAHKLDSMMRDDDEVSLEYARRRGFELDRHMYSSRLAVADFDEHELDGLIESVEQQGIRLFTMQDVGNTGEAKQKLYELNKYIDSRIPGQRLFPSFDEFNSMVFESDWYDPETQIVAADGDNWIGMTAAGLFAPDTLTMTMTGVHENYGGKGIGTALKLMLVRHARQAGVAYVMAGNDSHNKPMLRVNQKLGFKKLRGTYYVQKLVSSAE